MGSLSWQMVEFVLRADLKRFVPGTGASELNLLSWRLSFSLLRGFIHFYLMLDESHMKTVQYKSII